SETIPGATGTTTAMSIRTLANPDTRLYGYGAERKDADMVPDRDGEDHIAEVRGKQLALREFEPLDWPAMHAWASRPEVCRFQTWGPNTPEETQSFLQTVLAAAAARPRGDFTLAATLLGSDVPIGSGALYLRDHRFRTGEIAYV